MILDNKFKIGQRLWPIQCITNKWFVQRPFDLQYISSLGREVKYGFTTEYGFFEVDVFDSEERAVRECQLRNRSAAGEGSGR